METLIDLLQTSRERFGNNVAARIREGGGDDEWTYERLWLGAHAAAQHFRDKLGLSAGDRVVVWAPNSPRLVAVYFGAWLARLALVPLDPLSAPGFVERVVRETEARAAIRGFPDEGLLPPELTEALADLDLDTSVEFVGARPEPGDVAEIVFTSGTTGQPKGVVLTHANILASVLSASQLLPHRPYRLLSLLPLSHMFEQTVGLYIPMLFGSTVRYTTSRQPRVLAEAMVNDRITTMVVVPQALELLLRRIEQEARRTGQGARLRRALAIAGRLPMRLRRLLFRGVLKGLGGELDFFVVGGAKLQPETADTWERMGVRVIQGYGMTECSPIVACNSYAHRRQDAVGRPAPGVEVRLSPDGELLVRGANVTGGYWRRPEATAAAFTDDGWYRTGDLGTRDRDGSIQLQGRLKELIVLANGMKVYPEDVELELLKEDAIAECVVVAAPDVHGRPEVHAVVIPREREADPALVTGAVAASIQHAGRRLAPHQRVSTFTLWGSDELPRTSVGKVKRHEVLAAIAERRTAPKAEGADDRS